MLRIFDSSGLEVYAGSAGAALSLPVGFVLSADPWDPAQGPLILSLGPWSHSFDGRDSSGAVLRNGVYVLSLSDAQGTVTQKTLRVLGAGLGRVQLLAGPNPVRPGQGSILIKWSPITLLELKIYSLDGALVRDFGLAAAPPMLWNLRNAQGSAVANGIYVVIARLSGERHPQIFKLMVAR